MRPVSSKTSAYRAGFTLLDTVAVVACVAVVLSLAASTQGQLFGGAERSRRVKCANNLKRIGEGMILYGNENNNRLPRVRYDMKAAPTEYTGAAGTDPFVGKDAPEPNDVTAAIFLLVRTQDLGVSIFVCPSSDHVVDAAAKDASKRSNFAGPEHLSYSVANPYPDKDAVSSGYKWTTGLGAEFAIAGDLNPGTEALKTLTPKSTAKEMQAGNSLNHRSDGQNVLYGDFHFEWTQNPLVGISRDNIYTRNKENGLGAVPGITGSTAADDSWLLPIARAKAATRPATVPAK